MSKPFRRTTRRSQIENLEARQVMSADPLAGLMSGAISHHGIQEDPVGEVQQHLVDDAPSLNHHTMPEADFWLDPLPEQSLEQQLDQIEKSLSSAHRLTGLDDVREDYGFSGAGQTVVVIDSGIAYDHYALGGGLGSNYRVVGGWDFTEGDADPYDDGDEGSHGTHVAGIIGADDGDRSGVAPGADLVGLRVFNDVGAGYFSWVESALQWVHDNRNSFENPITTVNLSLGTNWNSSTTPAWAMLENEFQRLEADGIFISVSAGNSYTSYNEPGLSYPAASPYVVPVMSSDDSGFLSYFSQRHERAISAPGRYIYSTVPDYAGNHNGVTDDWANFSGTSMAAPYVAGGSVLIREAMEFVGYTNITQDMIFDHMIETADTFYDSSSGASYSRLNLEAAIDALMPEDDFGSSVADAYNLGAVNAGVQANAAPMEGHIATLADADFFTFTAGATGTVTFTASNMTHAMDAAWEGAGWANEAGDSYTMNVVAGQQYTVGLSSADGLGYYGLDVMAESTFTYTDWGAVATQETRNDLTATAETYYRLEAGQSGFVTAEALYDAGSVQMELYNANLEIVATATSDRLDYYADAGEELFLRVSGAGEALDLRLTNAVSVVGSVVTVAGTEWNDWFGFTAGEENSVCLNGVWYSFAEASQFDFYGGVGEDSISITGSTADEDLRAYEGRVDFNSAAFAVDAYSVEDTRAYSGGGYDRAFMYDTSGDEVLSAYDTHVEMSGDGFVNRAYGFETTFGYASQGYDRAFMYDGAGSDTFVSWKLNAQLYGAGFSNSVSGFDQVVADGSSGGSDRAYMYDSVLADVYNAYSDKVVMTGSGFSNEAAGFESAYAYSSGQADTAHLHGSDGVDVYSGSSNRVSLSGTGYYNRATGFSSTFAYGASGADFAYLTGGANSDVFVGWSTNGLLYGTGYSNRVSGFERVDANTGAAGSRAYFYDTAQNDVYNSDSAQVSMSAAGYYNVARGFSYTYATSSSGADVAYLRDSSGNDVFVAAPTQASMSGAGYYNRASGFSTTQGYASTGADDAVLTGSAGADVYVGWGGDGILYSDAYYNRAYGFDNVTANGAGGADGAYLYDSAGTDVYDAYSDHVQMSGAGYVNRANGFASTYAYSYAGNDTANFHDSAGADSFEGSSQRSSMQGRGYYNRAVGFASLTAYSTQGADTAVLFDSALDDQLDVENWGVRLQHGAGTVWDAFGFDEVEAHMTAGGNDTVATQSVDYAFELI